jgi:hypothetical protein
MKVGKEAIVDKHEVGVSPDIRKRAAYHKAGHATILRRFNRQEFQYSHIILTKDGHGRTETFQPVYAKSPSLTGHQMCLLAMAGRAAEQIRHPELSYEEVKLLSL